MKQEILSLVLESGGAVASVDLTTTYHAITVVVTELSQTTEIPFAPFHLKPDSLVKLHWTRNSTAKQLGGLVLQQATPGVPCDPML